MTEAAAKPIDLRKTCIWAGVLILIDAFVLFSGMIAALVGLVMLLAEFPRAMFFTKDSVLRGQRLARASILLAAAALTIGVNRANIQISQERAETLVAAIKAFHQQNRRYPETLDELVPGFIDHVPVARYTLVMGPFDYRIRGERNERHSLVWAGVSPFNRRIYDFERGTWGRID